MNARGADAVPGGAVEYLGVYDADGGLAGEVAYLVGHLFGTAECALCDITHSWRRKREWDEMTERLGKPFTLLHRNGVADAAVLAVIDRVGLPVVLARTADDTWHPLLERDALSAADGSVPEFERMLRG